MHTFLGAIGLETMDYSIYPMCFGVRFSSSKRLVDYSPMRRTELSNVLVVIMISTPRVDRRPCFA